MAKQDEHKTMAFRLDAQLETMIETWRKHLEQERPGTIVSTSDAVRTLLLKAIERPEIKRVLKVA